MPRLREVVDAERVEAVNRQLGYQDHYLIDGGKARIILHAFVTPGDAGENQVLIDQLRRTLFRRKLHPARLIADARYGTGPNVHAIEDLGIHAYVPQGQFHGLAARSPINVSFVPTGHEFRDSARWSSNLSGHVISVLRNRRCNFTAHRGWSQSPFQ